MKEIKYFEIDNVYMSLKVNRFIRVTPHMITEKLIQNFDINIAHKDLIFNASCKFLKQKDTLTRKKKTLSEDEKKNRLLLKYLVKMEMLVKIRKILR